MIHILDVLNGELIEAEIVRGEYANMPLKKDGWNFNWKELVKEKDAQTFILRTRALPQSVQGVLHLKKVNEMLIMDVVEIAPQNIGSKNKKFDYVAGCLIAFACRESFKIEGDYKGFLTFASKTKLIAWYSTKYGAERALGQRMYIDPKKGMELIDKYLNRRS